MAVPWIHAGGYCPETASSAASTMAAAPSEDGQASRYRNGSHSIIESSTIFMSISARWRWAYGFRMALRRSFTATMRPMYSGAPDRRM
jgi:hypothetical protein